MFSPQLQKFGLTKTQSSVLDYLLESGESKARDIVKNVKHPRGVVYKALDELLELELVEKIEGEKEIARFRAVHPRKLEDLLAKREKELSANKKIFEEVLPSLISNYNLTLNKPGVKFYEGREGLEKILYDTLTSKTEVYLFLNRDALAKEDIFQDINEEYKNKRIRAGVKKKIIRVSPQPELTFGTSNDKYDELTEIRYIEKTAFPFKAEVHIYDGKISYLIMDKGKIVCILVEDKNIYELNKFWFEMIWELAKT